MISQIEYTFGMIHTQLQLIGKIQTLLHNTVSCVLVAVSKWLTTLINIETCHQWDTLLYNTIQYKNDFYSAVIEGAEALVGRL